MRIFVTGGGGFIGSSLILALQNDHEVICFGHGTNYPALKNIFNENVQVIDGDIVDKKSVNKHMKDVDTVLHLAGTVSNKKCMEDPFKSTQSNIMGTRIILTESIKNEVQKFVFSSTQSVYTTYHQRQMPLIEDMDYEPDDFNGLLKTISEVEIRDSKINYTILRIANPYGYGSGLFVTKVGGAIGNFIKAAMEGSDIVLYGTGEQGIDYVHIDDFSDAVKSIIENNSLEREIFNIGSGELTKINKLAQTIIDVSKDFVKTQAKIKTMPAPEGSIWPDRLLSIDKIRKRIGWNPSISIEEGVKEIFERTAG